MVLHLKREPLPSVLIDVRKECMKKFLLWLLVILLVLMVAGTVT